MLQLKDLFHLPLLDPLIEQVVADGPGLIVVAGLDPRPLAMTVGSGSFRPSGRSAIFRILFHQILEEHPSAKAIAVAENREAVRVPRRLHRRVQRSWVVPPYTYSEVITAATKRRPDLLVVDQLNADNAVAIMAAATEGLRVLTQLDTVFRGADVAHALLDMGVSLKELAGLRWVLAVQRLETLCPKCRHPITPSPEQVAELDRRCPDLGGIARENFYRAVGCADCDYTGHQGDVAAFDLFDAGEEVDNLFEQPSLLSLEEYLLRLANLGYLPLHDILRVDKDQLRRTYKLLTASEQALQEAKLTLERKLVELEAANRVLQQRTDALISLQGISQALITAIELEGLAQRVCRQTRDLCGADRAVLYYRRSDEIAEVLAINGWDPGRLPPQLEANRAFDPADRNPEPRRFPQWPPGIIPRHPDVEGFALRAGLRAPLIAQEKLVGVMIVHTTEKQGFSPGEVALLQTLAQQAALALQRAEMIEGLRAKERLERELELARQVQQSVLPLTFPPLPGYTFAARNEPARQVGGDFYDIFSLDEARVGLVIADVSDKGMPAALYMALTRSLLLAEARRERSPKAVLENVHRLLLELGEPDMFVTVFYGVIDGPAHLLTYARAGHDPPLLLRDGAVEQLGGSGTFLGFADLDEVDLSEETLALQPGDRLVLYTDGLTDAVSQAGQSFDLAQLRSRLQSHTELPADELCATLFTELTTFQGGAPQYDDMTMLAIDVASF
jgi:serine phosphatase RsbU (regulator of sigma subunit)